MQSLLGQFYSKIKGSQEDIASEGLTYILKQSQSARNVINQIISSRTKLYFSDLSYTTQNVGKNLERPDISGKDINGKEVLLIEAKFWASLTPNQPNGYLERLKNNTVLLFLVPTLRTQIVFEEVNSKIKEKYPDTEIDVKNKTILIAPTKKYVLIKDWNEILNSIKSKLIQENNQNLISDIDQVIGLVDTIDRNSFLPISDIDLSPSIPRKINSYFDITDKVVNVLISKNTKINNSGLTGSQKKDYRRKYFNYNNLGCGFGTFLKFWEKYTDTPFWLSVSDNWKFSEKFKQKCEQIAFQFNIKIIEKNKEIFLSLKPKLHETEDNVINNLAEQIENIIIEISE